MADNKVVSQTFRALVESADRKFARVRDIPQYGRPQTHDFHKVFKAYMRLWKYQQENRSKLVEAGLNRWEIGEIASRIGQLYFNQYMRTSESRFLVEAYVFYEAILSRRYFEGSKVKDPGVRFKELRFYARFLLVSLILNRSEMVKLLVEKLGALVDESRATFRETNFKEWKLVVQEIVRFMNVDTSFTSSKPLRYSAILDSHPASLPYVARFHAKKLLKFQDALLTSYHRNEVKFAELTLDVYRMVQCLEWEPSGSFYQKRPIEAKENGSMTDHSGVSGVIDMHLATDLTDPSLPPNPRKAILYRPSAVHFLATDHSGTSVVIDMHLATDLTDPSSPPNPRKAILYRPSATRFLAVMATICDELPPESVMLIYLSAPGKTSCNVVSQMESSGTSSKTSKDKVASRISHDKRSMPESHTNGKGDTNEYYGGYLWFGPKGNGGSNNLYPGDIIPFTRKPIFLIIDSDNSHAFKVLHGAELGERAAIILSPLKQAIKNQPSSGAVHNGSQFTFFLTAPLRAFCQMVGVLPSNTDVDVYNNAEGILSTSFSAWEVILCMLTNLDLVWAQVLSDPFLRRLILRFIFCRSVLYFFCPPEDREQYLPVCLPHLPSSVSPSSDIVQSAVISLSNLLNVANCFRFDAND